MRSLIEMILSVEKISEHFLIPVLEQLLEVFSFIIKGFHSDNGSEYINKPVEKLLNKLLIEMTKSRSRQTNDNALVEGKSDLPIAGRYRCFSI
jgi:transposase InsO family protein